LRCGHCGNENSEANRFCGMCGRPLVPKTAPESQARATATPAERNAESGPAASSADARVTRSTAEAAPVIPSRTTASPANSPSTSSTLNRPTINPSTVDPPTYDSPTISGPSFLGLNTPADGRSVSSSSSHDSLRSSRNLDYLLEDDEPPSRGWGKLLLFVIALALVGGFGYLRWKQGGFDWLTKNENKPPASASTQPADLPPAADSGSTPNTVPAPAGASPTAAANGNVIPTDAPTPAPASPAPQTDNSQTTATQGNAPATATPQAGTAPASPVPVSPVPANSADSNPPANAAPEAAGTDSDAQSPQAETPPAPKPRERKPTPAKPVDSVMEAERYIYGNGARQDCDRGLRLLKSAAEQSNPKAMSSMGTLYSTGTCTPRDLPTAYRWFALALHKQPDNQALQDDLQKLWSQMTQPERQLAIKLSQ
jgi:hypothetical protein